MKKVISAILLFSIITLPSCDFLRKVAGRPDSSELAARELLVRMREKAINDSLKMVREAIEREKQRSDDSLRALSSLRDMGIRISGKSRFGTPVDTVKFNYNLVAGAFRTPAGIHEQMTKALEAGFNPYLISFSEGVKAVCLMGADDLQDINLMIKMSREDDAFPKDAWIYER